MAFSLTSKKSFLQVFGFAFASALLLSACVTDSDDKEPVTPEPQVINRQFLIDTGEVVFSNFCAGCHGTNGEGSRGPQLANSDYVMGSHERLITTVLAGNTDSIQVNGVWYPGGGMSSQASDIDDLGIAAILTYVRAVLNDSLVTNCVAIDDFSAECEKTERPAEDIAADSITVEAVAAVRDSLDLPAGPVHAAKLGLR